MLKESIKKMIYHLSSPQSYVKQAACDDLYNPYDGMQYLKEIPVTMIDKKYAGLNDIKFTLISPVKNEAVDVVYYLDSILKQTLMPDEIIIVDGGSTDHTPQIIRDYGEANNLPITVVEIMSTSISMQRNLAINSARNNIVVLADAGNILDENYCRNMVGPFDEFPDVDLVGAIYYALHDEYAQHFIYGWDGFEGWDTFLPAGKTMAIKKDIFQTMCGFPEFLAFTGEDTLFDLYYRQVSRRWVFNKAAFVYWDIPTTWEGCLKKFYSYGIGDGENHMGDAVNYLRYAKMSRGIHAPYDIPISEHMYAGYLLGREKRAEIENDKRNVQKVYIILSRSQLQCDDDMWILVKSYIEENCKVIYISSLRQFPTAHYIDFDFTLLELYDAGSFYAEDLLRRYGRYISKMYIKKNGELDDRLSVIARQIETWGVRHV
jgi:glycosyltransferase involved in cell wall biosynthesis